MLRRTGTLYRWDQALIDRRVIGLVGRHEVYEGESTLLSMTDYLYDWVAGYMDGTAPAVQHDTANYGSSLGAGRGILVAVFRYNANDTSQGIWAQTFGYNLAGETVWTADSLGHRTNISYGDSFSDGNNTRGTLAYPTIVTDPDGFSSFIQYNYDFGARTRVQGPPPANQSQGVIQTFTYDAAARPDRVTTVNNGAYTSYVYGPNYTQSFSSVNNIADDAYSIQILDGVGRVIGSAGNHPGSAGGYRGQKFIYDLMGRLAMQSNPAENTGVAPDWPVAGDDHPNNGGTGWIYSGQTYDWKGRPRVTTNTDLTTSEASYGGCGCAGGEVVTLTDEGTIDAGVAKRRQQKIYSDVLGRTVKTEVLNWEGGPVYSTTVNTYNALDQVTLARQFQGTAPSDPNDLSCPSGTCQRTEMSYDSYGRLKTKHTPEQDAGTATTWDYNPDDTIQKVTDARSANATYTYNGRHQVTTVTYAAPSGITATPNVSFAYDAAGNRTSMTDGLGSVSYNYNELSRLTSETRNFNSVGTFALSYDYNLAGELKKITDASNTTINYGYDNAGRVNGVSGSDNLVGGVSNYASSFQYRAWGGLKAITDGTNHTSSLLYNSKLQPTHFDISGNVVSQNYDYYNDGRISFVHNVTDINFDRSYFYDQVGRLTENKTGGVARNDYGDMPYYESFGYDAWSNLSSRESDTWNWQDAFSDYASYTNNRRVGWGYDSDGRNTSIDTRTYTFDAAGQITLMTGQQWIINHYVNVSQSAGYDGDGVKVRDTTSGVTTYYLLSSLLRGAIVEELSNSGAKNVGYVYSPGGQLLAQQAGDQVTWKHTTPASTSQYDTYSNLSYYGRTEFDPLGADIRLDAPPVQDTGGGDGDIGGSHFGGIMDARWADFFNLNGGCTIDGMAASCSSAMSAVNSGAAVIGPANTTRWNPNLNNGQGGYQFFHAWADGTQGWGPLGWVPGGSGPASHPGGRPTLKPDTPEARVRRRLMFQIFGRSGFGDEETELTNSPNYWFLQYSSSQPPYVRRSVLNDCLGALFGVRLGLERHFRLSRPGYNGGIEVVGPNDENDGLNTRYTIGNNVTDFTGAALKIIFNVFRETGVPKLGPGDKISTYVGPTPKADKTGEIHAVDDPSNSYTASDLTDPMAIVKAQIHGLGDALNRTIPLKYPGGLAGKKLEACVNKGKGFVNTK